MAVDLAKILSTMTEAQLAASEAMEMLSSSLEEKHTTEKGE